MDKHGSRLSIVIPVLNDAGALKQLLPQLQVFREAGHEVVLVDGGSTDGSVPAARSQVDRIMMTGSGRGRQMNLGAETAVNDVLLFLHADSQLPETIVDDILSALAASTRHWGRCKVAFDEPGLAYTLIASMMNLRSRVSGVATGDQGIFVKKSVFHSIGGYEDIPLMEDVSLSKTLRKFSWPLCPNITITTSARRWKSRGLVRTILLMWGLRLAYFFGADTRKLADIYYPGPETEVDRSKHSND